MHKVREGEEMNGNNDARMICKYLEGLTKEIRWLRLLVEEVVKAEYGRKGLEELEKEEE